jgi:hypothetical protein
MSGLFTLNTDFLILSFQALMLLAGSDLGL